MANLIKVREVSLKYGISARTLKYYEDMGLLQSTKKDDYAYRLFDQNAVKRLEQILILRKLNVKVKDIQRIFNSDSSEVVLEVLSAKVTDIDDEVSLLHELKEIVLDFIKQIEEYDFQKDCDIKLLYEKAKNIEQQIVNIDYDGNSSSVNRLLEVIEKLDKKPDVRIVEIPKVKMVSSGHGSLEELVESKFAEWFSAQPKTLMSHDFMWFDPEKNDMVWYYAITDETIDTGGLEIVDFEGGLYAAAISIDENDVDGQ